VASQTLSPAFLTLTEALAFSIEVHTGVSIIRCSLHHDGWAQSKKKHASLG